MTVQPAAIGNHEQRSGGDRIYVHGATGLAYHHRCGALPRGAPPYYYRDELDPMALGTCRYCGERLPVPPDKETDQSSALSS